MISRGIIQVAYTQVEKRNLKLICFPYLTMININKPTPSNTYINWIKDKSMDLSQLQEAMQHNTIFYATLENSLKKHINLITAVYRHNNIHSITK